MPILPTVALWLILSQIPSSLLAKAPTLPVHTLFGVLDTCTCFGSNSQKLIGYGLHKNNGFPEI